jgi:hypothetical protein
MPVVAEVVVIRRPPRAVLAGQEVVGQAGNKLTEQMVLQTLVVAVADRPKILTRVERYLVLAVQV